MSAPVKRTIPIVTPPAPISGGRILTPAGELTQLVGAEAFRHLAYLEFLPDGGPRGNHYHRKKHEFVYVIKGRLEVISIDITTGKREVFVLKTGDLLESPPKNAHSYRALEYTMAVEFAPQPFDTEDTVKYEVR